MNGSTYIISCDLHKRIAQMAHCGVVVPDKCFDLITEFHNGLKNLVLQCYPNDNVLFPQVDKMSADVLQLVGKIQEDRDVYVVSTGTDFAVPRRGFTLEVNRLIGEDGKIIGIGARPGHLSLDEQFAKIASIAGRQPVVLVEDGIFSGLTSKSIIDGLKKHKVNVTDVVACFAFPQGIEKLASSLKNVKVHCVQPLENLRDWVPDHDFFPAAPNCGRVLGVKLAGSFMPYYDKAGTSFSVPYILPFSPIQEWASIPGGMSFRFSDFCLRKSVEFYDIINVANGRRVEFGNLQHVEPRISVPISVNSEVFPSKHEAIFSHLSSALVKLNGLYG